MSGRCISASAASKVRWFKSAQELLRELNEGD
jgi:hypothetical protein